MTIRKGSEKFFLKPELACYLAVIASSKPGYIVLLSRLERPFRDRHYVSLSVSLPVSVSVLALLTPPLSLFLYHSLSFALTLLVALFVCDSDDSRS